MSYGNIESSNVLNIINFLKNKTFKIFKVIGLYREFGKCRKEHRSNKSHIISTSINITVNILLFLLSILKKNTNRTTDLFLHILKEGMICII